eukprot:15349585-Ditylum_brightwellii.AAC.1
MGWKQGKYHFYFKKNVARQHRRSVSNCIAIATTLHPTASCQQRKVGSDFRGGERDFVGRWKIFAVGGT